jgi:glucose-1-phosphate thymidylyltransferase
VSGSADLIRVNSRQEVKGLILSGGKGTRLRPITHTSAKQLVPIANKPILFYGIEAIVAAGITDIGIITGETGDEVRDATGDGSDFGAKITYIPQDAPLGLAHAVLTAKEFLDGEPFVLYLGDNLIRYGIVPIVEEFRTRDPDALILLAAVPNPEQFGVAELDGERVVRLVEKPAQPKSNLALVGVYLFKPTVFEAIDKIQYSPRGELEITDAIQEMIDSGKRVESHLITTEPEAKVATWKDTGRLDDILEANRIVLDDMEHHIDGTVSDDVTLTGKVTIEAGAKVSNSTISGPSIIGKDTVIEGAEIGPYTAIYYGCTVKNAAIENSIVLERCHISDIKERIDYSLIGKECEISKTGANPGTLRLMLGDHSKVERN